MKTLLLSIMILSTTASAQTQPQICDLGASPDLITRFWQRVHCWGTPNPEHLCYEISDDSGPVFYHDGPPVRLSLGAYPPGQVGIYYSPTSCTWLPVFGTPEDIQAQFRAFEDGLGEILKVNGSTELPMPSRGEDITVEVEYIAFVGKKTVNGCEKDKETTCMGSYIRIKISLW